MRFSKEKFGIIDLLNTGFLAVVFVIYLFSLHNSPYLFGPLFVFLLTAVVIWMAVRLRQKEKNSKIERLFLTFYPLIYLFVIFESFFMILPYVNLNRYDQELANIDYSWFGVHPTVWIEHFVRPRLTDIMYALYIFYFPMPLFILGYLYKKKRLTDLDKSVFVYLVVYYTAYLGYFIVPAAGPRFYEPLMQLQTKNLDGMFLAVPIRNIINFLEPNKLDAFPSLHSAISFTTLLVMAKYNRRMFWIFLPVITGIFVSLVYCRYHYVVDIVAGVGWSLTGFLAGNWFYTKFVQGKFTTFVKFTD